MDTLENALDCLRCGIIFFSLYWKTGLKYKMWRLDDRYSLRSKTWSCAGGAFDGEVDGFF